MGEKIETILFLGAGASAAEEAPIQKKIFETYFDPEWSKKIR